MGRWSTYEWCCSNYSPPISSRTDACRTGVIYGTYIGFYTMLLQFYEDFFILYFIFHHFFIHFFVVRLIRSSEEDRWLLVQKVTQSRLCVYETCLVAGETTTARILDTRELYMPRQWSGRSLATSTPFNGQECVSVLCRPCSCRCITDKTLDRKVYVCRWALPDTELFNTSMIHDFKSRSSRTLW